MASTGEVFPGSGTSTAEIPWDENGAGEMGLCQLLDINRAKVGDNHCAIPVAMINDDTTIITEGDSADLWGNALTRAWVQDADFGVAIGCEAAADNCDVFVDYVTIEIEYTESAPSASESPSESPSGSGMVGQATEA